MANKMKKGVRVRVDNRRKWGLNPRKTTEVRKQRLGENMEEFGDLSGVTYCRINKAYVTGNQRSDLFDGAEVEELLEYEEKTAAGTVAVGWIIWKGERWPYREVEFSEEKFARACLVANTHAGEWDAKAVIELADLQKIDLGAIGLDVREIIKEIEKRDKEQGKKGGEIVWSVPLGRELNYLVVFFEIDVDWINARTRLGIDSTYSVRQNGKAWSKGVGRVISWSDLLDKLEGKGGGGK